MDGGEKITRITSRIAGLAVGALFVYAGVMKALDPAQFAGDIANYRILPWPAAATLALYLPWLEIFCGGALIFRRLHPGAPLILIALCLVFLGALASAKIRGLDIACGCFGHTGSHHLLFSTMLDVAVLATLVFVVATRGGGRHGQ